MKDTSRQSKRQKVVEKEEEKDVFAIHKKAQTELRKDKLWERACDRKWNENGMFIQSDKQSSTRQDSKKQTNKSSVFKFENTISIYDEPNFAHDSSSSKNENTKTNP